MSLINCAVDSGNSAIKIVIEGKKVETLFPTIAANPKGVGYESALIMRDSSISGANKLHVEVITNRESVGNIKGKECIFGKMAETFPASLHGRDNTLKSLDKDLVCWMITSLAYSLHERRIQSGEAAGKEETYRVRLATGLPYAEAQNIENMKNYRALLKGNHLVKFKHPFFNNLQVELIIEDVYVFAEGESALSDLLQNIDIAVTEDLLNSIFVLVDVGGLSTEIIGTEFVSDSDVDEYNLDSDLTIVPVSRKELCFGIAKGIGTIYDSTIADVRAKESAIKRELSRRDIEKAFGRFGLVNGSTGWIKPEGVNISKYFNDHAKAFAQEIAKKFYADYNANNVTTRVQKIFISGGGAMVTSIVSTLKEILAGMGYASENIICVDDPVYRNVTGYYDMMLDSLSQEETEEVGV